MYLQQNAAFKQRGNDRDGYDGVKFIDRGKDLLLLLSFVQHERQCNHGLEYCEKLNILHITTNTCIILSKLTFCQFTSLAMLQLLTNNNFTIMHISLFPIYLHEQDIN